MQREGVSYADSPDEERHNSHNACDANHENNATDVEVKAVELLEQDYCNTSWEMSRPSEGLVKLASEFKQEKIEWCDVKGSDVNNCYEREKSLCPISGDRVDEGDIPGVEVKVEMEEDLNEDDTNDWESEEPGTIGIEKVDVGNGEEKDTPYFENSLSNGESEAFHLKKEVRVTTERLYECETCEERFAQYNEFRSHIAGHTFRVCQTCGTSFGKMSEVRHHLNRNFGEGPLKCEMCGKSFSHANSLRHHKLIHRERPHYCHICGKCFAQPSHLIRHQSVYSGKRPHTCETCGKSFHEQRFLKDHVLIHSKEGPFSCEICGKSFRYESQLRLHILNNSKKTLPKCETCRKTSVRGRKPKTCLS